MTRSPIRAALRSAALAAPMLSILLALAPAATSTYAANPGARSVQFPACDPTSEVVGEGVRPRTGSDADLAADLSLDYCADWNPEFKNNGHHCCAKFVRAFTRKARRTANRCAPERRVGSYCFEMTEEQRQYTEDARSGALGDLLAHIVIEMGRKGEQAHCTVNNGFLSNGRRIIPTPQNRIALRSPDRCVDFGTDYMAGMIEWVGRQVAREYDEPGMKGVRLVLGDVAAPRGGCLSGRSGRRGHASHTSGKDADIGFLTVVHNSPSPLAFHRKFDPKANWWFIKQIFANPFACVKVIFLDRKHINKLARYASRDGGGEDWKALGRFIRHMPAHKDHLHVRIGDGPGRPGCLADAKPELELEEDLFDEEGMSEGATSDPADPAYEKGAEAESKTTGDTDPEASE